MPFTIHEQANETKTYIPFFYFARGLVSDSAGVLFDDKTPYTEDNERIQALKGLQLGNMVYSDTNNPNFFKIQDASNGNEVVFSNRESMGYELRGKNLRHLLDMLKIENPQMTLYDALVQIIKDPRCSDYAQMIKGAFVGPTAEYTYGEGNSLSEESFYFFMSQLEREVNKDGRLERIFADYPSIKEVNEKLSELAEEIFAGIDIDAIFTPIYELDEQIGEEVTAIMQNINQMVSQFAARGQYNALRSAKTLQKELRDGINDLYQNKLSVEAFQEKCHDAIKAAAPELKTHRGWPGLCSEITRLISIVASWFGKQTDSVVKLQQMKKNLDSIKLDEGTDETPTPSV